MHAPTSFHTALGHLNTAARLVLEAENEDACDLTMTAVIIAGSRTSHIGALARAMHGVIQLYVTNGVDANEDLSDAVLFLLRSGTWVPGSPEIAYVVGAGLARAGLWELVRKWAAMVVEVDDADSDARLASASTFLFALCATDEGRFEDARSLARQSAMLAVTSGFDALAVRASSMSGFLDLLVDEQGPDADSTARILPAALGADGGLRVESQIAMALSELLASDATAASAWLCSAFDSLSDQSLTLPLIDSSVALMAMMLLLTDWSEAAIRLLGVVCPNTVERSNRAAVCSLLRGIAEENPDSAIDRLGRAAADADGSQMVRLLASVSRGARLLRADERSLAHEELKEVRARLAALELRGLVDVVDRLLEQVEPGSRAAGPTASRGLDKHRLGVRSPESEGSTWRLTLLGDFSIERDGARFDLPQSVSTQALKLLAVRRRVTVDELVDILWPESDNDIGSRRLRNVLWRIRSACGDLVHREGNLICLAESASTDIEEFESRTSLALSSSCPSTEASRAAEEALALYAGPLLPGDLFVDWTAPHRESLGLLHVRVLDFLLSHALDEGRTNDALSLLEQMIEVEPFEESHYIQAAELYVQSGRPQRARTSLDRARRMLLELGVEPSSAYRQVLQKLSMISA